MGFKSSRWLSMIGQKQACGSGSEPFGVAVMGPDPRQEGTAGESEPGLSVFCNRRPHVSTLASKLIGAVAPVQASRVRSEASVQSAVSPRL